MDSEPAQTLSAGFIAIFVNMLCVYKTNKYPIQ